MSFLLLSLFLFLLSFSQEVRVSTIVQGKVEGDLLVSIDPVLYRTQAESLRAQLGAQKINLEKVERDFKRYEELFNRGLLSKSEYEDWKSKYERELYQYEALRAQVERLEKLIEYCSIRSCRLAIEFVDKLGFLLYAIPW